MSGREGDMIGFAGQSPSVVSQIHARRLHRRFFTFVLALLLFVLFMGLAEQAGAPRLWLGAAFLVVTVSIYAVIGLSNRTTNEAEYYVAGRRVPAIYNGMATAADWMSTASFIGTAGVLYLQGFGGLAYILGWTGGYCLIALLLAPYLRRFGQYTLTDFIGARYGGRWTRVLAVGATILVSVVYLIVQLYGVGLITSHLTGFSFEIGIFVGLGGVLVCSFLGGMRAVTWTQVAQYFVLILAYLVPVVWLAVQQVGHPFLPWAMEQQLGKITAREIELAQDSKELEARSLYAQRATLSLSKLDNVPQSMRDDVQQLTTELQYLRGTGAPLDQIQRVERRMVLQPQTEAQAHAAYVRQHDQSATQAQPLAGMPVHAQPYPDQPMQGLSSGQARINFVALVFCLMLGTAAMPHVLTRCYTTPTVREARRSVMWSLFFISLLYVAAPALAIFVKMEVFSHLVGLAWEDLPAWVRSWSRIDPALISVEDINSDRILQLAELRLDGDVIVLAAPEIAGMPFVVSCLVAAGGLAAALSTADGLLLTIASSISHDTYFRLINPRASAIRRVMLSKVMVLAVALFAAYIASLHLANILGFVSVAFSLAASTFFPVLVLGVFSQHANRWGAISGMAMGLLVCLYYVVTNVPWTRELFGVPWPAEDTQWFGLDPAAAGVFGVSVGFLVVTTVSLLTRHWCPPTLQVVTQVRYPNSGAAG